ncbi:ATP-binding protein [bacterium]|nr:ATP-binding protein [bacterium]
MYPRLCNPLLSKSFFLFGARGTGKTKLLQQLFQDQQTLWIDLLQEGALLNFTQNPSQLRHQLAAQGPNTKWVVIDEVQRVPALLNEVHSLIEDKSLNFALTGSSARKLRRGQANLLAGRALVNNLFPLTQLELGHDFQLESALRWGTLPGVITEKDESVRAEILKSYVHVYLKEEIREEQIIRSLDPFTRFLEAAAQSNGTIVNLSKLGREANTDAKSIARYFQILEDTLLGFFVDPYHRSIRKQQRKQAKFYLFDLGVKRTLDGTLKIPLSKNTYDYGKLFEQFIILEVLRLNSYFRSDYKIYYLKTDNQLEIDLILERKGDATWVIEIKSAERPDLTEVSKLMQLAKDIPHARAAIFCQTTILQKIDSVEIFPWQEGLEAIFK